MSESGPIPPAVLQQALEWQVTLWSGEVTADEQLGFQRWLAGDPDHARAWAQVRRADDDLQCLSRPIAAEALRTGAAASRRSRRAILGAVGALAGTGLAAQSVRQTAPWQRVGADHASGRGERREIALPDGARVWLGSATAIDVNYDARVRQVLLRAGEIFITTAPDASPAALGGDRPFMVRSAEGSMLALGTRFGVRRRDEVTEVAVQEGVVELRPLDGGTAGVVQVRAGEQARFDRRVVAARRTLEANATAWTRGLLVAERMRLEDFLGELGRYRNGVVRCDPAVRDLIVSGVYSLDDTDQALRHLARALPVEVRTATRWWVTVRPRAVTSAETPTR